MANPYLGEIRIFSFDFAPYNWALCQGQLLPISQYTALYSLLGTSFGGNGTSNFALPNLQGRMPLGTGSAPGLTSYDLGESAGTATASLNQVPSHTHALYAQGLEADKASPAGDYLAMGSTPSEPHKPGTPYHTYVSTGGSPKLVSLAAGAIAPSGSGGPFPLGQPNLGLNFCIALTGVFPPRS